MNKATVTALGPGSESLVVEIDPAPPMPPTTDMLRRWSRLSTENPRLFDGRILACLHADPGRVLARVESYRRMATQPRGPGEMVQLGVTGILTAPASGGGRTVLLGRRSERTQIYPGRWELAPSGGVDAPGPGVQRLTLADLKTQLGRELREETGIDPAGVDMRAVALCHDPGAPSTDIVFRIDLPEPPARHATWEFDELVWFETARLADRLAERSIEPTDPSVALLRWCGWL